MQKSTKVGVGIALQQPPISSTSARAIATKRSEPIAPALWESGYVSTVSLSMSEELKRMMDLMDLIQYIFLFTFSHSNSNFVPVIGHICGKNLLRRPISFDTSY